MGFEHVDAKFPPSNRIKREAPQEGDPCADPRCGGSIILGLKLSDPRPLKFRLVCSDCGKPPGER